MQNICLYYKLFARSPDGMAETAPQEEVAMGGMAATVLDEEEKEGLKETEQMETMDMRDNRD